MPAPWEKYSVGTPSSNPNFTETECARFSTLTHITHIPNALNIIAQQTIRPQLVYDESILNTRRILVNWVSPNDWFYGSRYGNICFHLDWRQLIHGKKYYWVESIERYNPHACRILITDQEYDKDANLLRYDPTERNGPWWYDSANNIHYRNGHCCLEFMLEFELPLFFWTKISFVDHHHQYCCVDPSSCPDLATKDDKAGGRFLAGLVANDSRVNGITFDERQQQNAWISFYADLPREGYTGKIAGSDPEAGALARSVAAAYIRRRNDEIRAISQLFADRHALAACLEPLILEKFANAAFERG